ncbi:MAG: hypothetical protein EPN45_00450 [Rhizobiaceae bacterium]|jgi:hypothetical protein|nr:MAG: hypothetical protein EPN45_00450 [Rhizobiaceae bacterium]
MQTTLMITIAVHALTGVFWAGTTFALARLEGAYAERFFRPQMGAAVLAVLSGALLWHFLHEGGVGAPEMVLSLGILTALVAAGVQGAMIGSARRKLAQAGADETRLRLRMVKGERIASALLAITIVCMVIQRYA